MSSQYHLSDYFAACELFLFRMPLVSGVMGFYHFPSTRVMSGGFTFVGESKAPFISKFVEFYTVSVLY
jgi:hypothetical protein